MRSCTVIISHFESVNFLRACLKQTLKHIHPEIKQKIIVVDQSGDKTHNAIMDEFGNIEGVQIVRTKPLYSGYGVDFLIQRGYIDTEYVAQLHVDAFGISDQWLYLPIKLIEEYNLAFCGQLQFINDKNNLAHIYPPSPMFAMAQCFNIGRTEVYKEMSYQAGFTRFHNRPWVEEGITWKDTSWDEWAAPAYQERGSDDDVVAFSWADKYRQDDRLGLAITGYIEPSYGRIIEDIVLHFGSANEARGVMGTMPPLYQDYTRRINENYSDELIEEIISRAKANRPPQLEILSRNFWNGTTKESMPTTEDLNKRIEELKKL